MRQEFTATLIENQSAFGLGLTNQQIQRLADHYELVVDANALLHLVAPCSPQEFAIRHTLESLTLLEHLPANCRLADIGPGGGFPSLPCLLVRNDLRATLIESKKKKADSLEQVIARLGLDSRVEVIAQQYSETDAGRAKIVTCRALDRFLDHVPRLLRWSGPRDLVLFGGESLGAVLEAQTCSFVRKLIPLSERRFLFVVSARS